VITFTAVFREVPGLTEAELSHWLEADFVRPARQQGEVVFSEADVARIRLIQDLRAMLEVDEATLPLVLSLLDQLYETRWRLRQILKEKESTSF
jgi:chaperone modulatory protein CbpM